MDCYSGQQDAYRHITEQSASTHSNSCKNIKNDKSVCGGKKKRETILSFTSIPMLKLNLLNKGLANKAYCMCYLGEGRGGLNVLDKQTFQPPLASLMSFFLPIIPLCYDGCLVVLAAGALLGRALCGLHSDGHHFGVGGEVGVAAAGNLPLRYDAVDG